jgi:c(7)-type cytochrome triheme protein
MKISYRASMCRTEFLLRQMYCRNQYQGKEVRHPMKTFLVGALAMMMTLLITMAASAVPSGKTVEFEPKGAGKVIFDGKVHADKGLKCADCHQGLFKMKKGADVITMKDMQEGKFCGACHNGTKAFSVKDAANCGKCHKK